MKNILKIKYSVDGLSGDVSARDMIRHFLNLSNNHYNNLPFSERLKMFFRVRYDFKKQIKTKILY